MDETLLCPNCKTGQIVVTQLQMIQKTEKNQFHFVADARCKKCKMQYKLEGDYNSKRLESFTENSKTSQMG